jgi:hypothetical protein
MDVAALSLAALSLWGWRSLWQAAPRSAGPSSAGSGPAPSNRALALYLGAVLGVGLGLVFLTLGCKAGWEWFRYLLHLSSAYGLLVALGLDALFRALPHTLPRAALGLAAASTLLPGQRAWQRDARRDRSAHRKQVAAWVDEAAPRLAGTLLLAELTRYADETAPLRDGHFLVRRVALPAYELSPEGLRILELRPVLGGLSQLPWPAAELASPPAGAYAVLSRDLEPASCDVVRQWLPNTRVEARLDLMAADPRVPVCALAEQEGLRNE